MILARTLLFTSLSLCLSAGCVGGDGRTALEGIYVIESWTHNAQSCEEGGVPGYEEDAYSHLFIRDQRFFGQRYLTAVTCSDLAECRDMAAETDTLYLGGFTFIAGNDADGWTGESAAYLYGEACTGSVRDARLTGEAGVSIRIEERWRNVDNVPEDDEGFCDTDAAIAQAEGKPCSQLTLVKGSFLEAI